MEAPAEVNVINNMNNDANILKTEEPTINGGTAAQALLNHLLKKMRKNGNVLKNFKI